MSQVDPAQFAGHEQVFGPVQRPPLLHIGLHTKAGTGARVGARVGAGVGAAVGEVAVDDDEVV